ncbi:MAG TPA: HesA/MoeB/ThiF family protein [Phycisphaerae bacterium]|nr:HesA/MoeB/ThiF family protein [Phycisphaerae bacterium]HPS53354.1 HesA/MoeB/ThiF family protein [Phycisphaerae bacterium]
MIINSSSIAERYSRQIAFDGWSDARQQLLGQSRVLIVGVGGLGSWVAELLVRAGVGFLRLADYDTVEISNIHRQAMYDELDAQSGMYKADVAGNHLRQINGKCKIEPACEKLDRFNIFDLTDGIDLIIDGTDNFWTRFIINDYCVKNGMPWIFGGAVRAEGQMAVIIPGKTLCLRCLLDYPPAQCDDSSCAQSGVFGPAVAAVAAFQAMEAIKYLGGCDEMLNPHVMKLDMWSNRVQYFDATSHEKIEPCPCCDLHEFEFLEP